MYAHHTLRAFAIAAAIAGADATGQAQVRADADARFATVNLSYIARSSKAGRAALSRLEEAGKQKEIEAAVKAKELQKQQAALEQQGSVMSERARADLERAFARSRTEFDRFRQDAAAELKTMQADIEADFRLKLIPVVDQISKEKGFHFVFGLEQSTLIVWANPALDISEEVVKRLDAERQ